MMGATFLWKLRFSIFILSMALIHAMMEIPPSFSAVHKTTYLQDNSPIESVIKVLSSFEINSHIEVVLVGNSFTTAVIDELSKSLKVLSDVAAAASPLKFVHEQLVYHVSLGVGLEDKVREIIQKDTNAVSIDRIGELLGEFHAHAATPTTIFVIHSGSLNSHIYETKVPTCPQRTYLAKAGFALIDLSAKAEKIRSTATGNDHVISDTDFSFLEARQQQGGAMPQTSVHDLATLIHRSGESLVPFPIFSSDKAFFGETSSSTSRKSEEIGDVHYTKEVHYVDEEAPVQDEALIEIVVFTLCMTGMTCVDDAETKHAVQNLLSSLYSDTNNVNHVSVYFSADTDPQIAHAIHAATSYSATGRAGNAKISSTELLFWLSSSTAVRNVLSKQGRYFVKRTEFVKRVLPVFILELPRGVELLLDGSKQVMAKPFPQPAGGWLNEDDDANSMFSLHRQKVFESNWPSSAVIALTAPGRPLIITPSIECGGYWIPRGDQDYVSELVQVLQAAVWGILPTHTHYSSSSRGLVQDYLWSVPPLLSRLLDKNSNKRDTLDLSFREVRQIRRHNVIHSCDQIIGRFSDILLDASSIRPAINITSILGLKEHRPSSSNRRTVSTANPFSKNKNSAKDALPKKEKKKEDSLFTRFLKHLNLAAASFSHLDYEGAQTHLKYAEMVQIEMKSLVDSMLNMRSGSLTCRDMRIETKIQTLANKAEGIPETEYKHEKGVAEKKHAKSRKWTWIFGVLGSVLLGCIIGYDVASSKSRRVLR